MKCEECNGTGQKHTPRKVPDTLKQIGVVSGGTIVKCDKCNGSGEVIEEKMQEE